MSEERFETLRFLEAMLFAAAEPLTEKVMAHRLPDDADVKGLLEELKGHYANRGVVLMQFEDRWAFRTAPDLSHRMSIERKVVRKLTRAAVETLAIIAYHQPVTRAEIEEIRGVAISKGTLDSLLEADWIKPKGRRETPGRPVTWGTTTGFLEHFSLESCEALPGVEELRAAGLLDARSAISTLGTQGGAAGQLLRGDGSEEEEAAAAIELRGEPELESDEEGAPAKVAGEEALSRTMIMRPSCWRVSRRKQPRPPSHLRKKLLPSTTKMTTTMATTTTTMMTTMTMTMTMTTKPPRKRMRKTIPTAMRLDGRTAR
ncbi:MAG: SMC-Scp complex subunit ScpB [Rhodospirillaceae bacterium]|nr:SMC-Scp complex subunit ScpB [Rhodospirillaceae bacterium]